MNQPKQTLFRLAVLSGLVALRAPASTLLTPITTLADCAVDSARALSPTSCALNFAGSASASLTLSPFVSLTAEAASPPNGGVIHGAAARAILTYSFEVIGGNPGDIVPVLIATSLSSLGSDPSHGIGFAELSVHTGAAGDSFVAVCSDATCGTTASSFSGTLRTRARSGDTSNELTLQVQASTGDSLLASSASASADPFIFIDPSFPGAALYGIAVSPGVGNTENTAAPEPGTMCLLLGAAVLLAGERRRRTAARRVACVAALLWWAVGVGGRAEASVVLQTPPGLNPGDPFRFVFVTEGIRDAISTNIADYDSFVNAQAGGATYSGVLIDWLAIGSTDSVDAIDHVGQATAPVYLSDGTLVTSTTTVSGLWSRTLVHEINLDLAANLVQTFVWTGTNPFGTGFGGPLGALTPQVGASTDSAQSWIDSGRSSSGDLRPLYGISPVLTVPLAVVPEPSTLTILVAALSVCLAIGGTRHRRTQQGQKPWGPSFPPRMVFLNAPDRAILYLFQNRPMDPWSKVVTDDAHNALITRSRDRKMSWPASRKHLPAVAESIVAASARTWRIITFLMLLLLSPGAVAQAPAPCAPPHDTPVYTKPPDDSIVFGSLLEATGYGSQSNSDWVDIAAGNFCGGAEKELVLLKNRHSNFSILRGPAPFAVGAGDLTSNPSHPWRAVAAGNLDNDPYDEIVAVRKVTASGVPNLFVTKAEPASCAVSATIASATIGGPSDSDWLGVAIGNFDGKGNVIALLKAAHANITLLRFRQPGILNVFHQSDLDPNPNQQWKALAAGDIDGDGIDELIAAREVSDGKTATVLVFKWTGSAFRLFASSTFGNNGKSNWTGLTVGDFNADRRKAIVLQKNDQSNFAVLDLPKGATALRVLATANLDSANGQEWRGVVATDWLGGDQGAFELIAVRAAHDSYRTDLFVYGNPFHRIPRDSGLEGTKAQWDQHDFTGGDQNDLSAATSKKLVDMLKDTRTNTMNWGMVDPKDYPQLVRFLDNTKDYTQDTCAADGKHLRVWVTFTSVNQAHPSVCTLPVDSGLTTWKASEFFKNVNVLDRCKVWGQVLGRLARDYPHLVALSIDDFTHDIDNPFTPEYIAEMESGLQSQSPWLNFAPVTYYTDLKRSSPDLALTFDTMLYFFRDEQQTGCLPGPCGEASVNNAHNEFLEMSRLLPAGRKMQVGAYFGRLFGVGEPTPRYDYDLASLVLNLPWLGGITAYSMVARGVDCTDTNFLDDKFCTLRKVYGAPPYLVNHLDLTSIANAPVSAGDPFGYVIESQGAHNVVYRATDASVHELRRTNSGIVQSDLSTRAGAPRALGDPKALVTPTVGIENVLYRAADGHLHNVRRSVGRIVDENLTAPSHAPGPAGDPATYVAFTDGLQHAVYRGVDGHLHELFWLNGPAGHGDLTQESKTPGPVGNPAAYFLSGDGTQHVFFQGNGDLHELWWTNGPIGHGDLTVQSSAPPPDGSPAAYFAPTYGLQNVVYRGTDKRLHGLFWTTGRVGHDDLSRAVAAPPPASDPAAYFVTAEGTHYVIYRGTDNHLHELSWTTAAVTHHDLTVLASSPSVPIPLAVGNPSAYFVPADRTYHAIYRTSDGHLHDLQSHR